MKHLVFKLRFVGSLAFVMLAALWPAGAQAADNPTLGRAAGFAVLAGTAASCTTSTITGGVGVNFSPPTTAGCNAQFAHSAYMAFQSALGTKPTCTDSIIPDTFTGGSSSQGSGTHCAAAGLTFTNHTLNLTGSGPWNFVIGAGFTGTNLNVVLPIGGNPCNVFWWIGADATLTVNNGATVSSTPFQGTILGAGDITLTGTAGHTSALTLTGHVWATHAVTMTDSTIVGCTGGTGGTGDKDKDKDKDKEHCNQGVGNGSEGCDPGNSNQGCDSRSNDELGGTPGDPGRQGGNRIACVKTEDSDKSNSKSQSD